MSARVFISHRDSDGTKPARALARDLDASFDDGQVCADRDGLPVDTSRRDLIAGAPHGSILLVLVTPDYLGARDAAGSRCIDGDDDSMRRELASALAAGAHVVPLLCDGVDTLPSPDTLPKPFDRLCGLPSGRLRTSDWPGDLVRLAETLQGFGLTPRARPVASAPTSAPDAAPASAPAWAQASRSPRTHVAASERGDDDGPITTPMPLDAPGVSAPVAAASAGRRLALGTGALAVLGVLGWSALRWRRRRDADLSGSWRVRIGARGAASARDGAPVGITLTQSGNVLRVSSDAVDVTRDTEWDARRDVWRQRYGVALRRVFYRGDGTISGAPDDRDSAGAAVASSDADSASSPANVGGKSSVASPVEKPATWPPGAVVRRIEISMQIYASGRDGEALDGGVLRGIVDADDRRIRARLWLDGERAEHQVDLRRA